MPSDQPHLNEDESSFAHSHLKGDFSIALPAIHLLEAKTGEVLTAERFSAIDPATPGRCIYPLREYP